MSEPRQFLETNRENAAGAIPKPDQAGQPESVGKRTLVELESEQLSGAVEPVEAGRSTLTSER
jgi:hypothetical protein